MKLPELPEVLTIADDDLLPIEASDGTKKIKKKNAIPFSKTDFGKAGGIATLDENGHVPTSQLPSYVDDVIEGYFNEADNLFYKDASFTTKIAGEKDKIYVDLIYNKTYRFSSSIFVEISKSIALGETEYTAYRGDRGKEAYETSISNKSNIGVLSNLTTDDKTNLVNAINQIKYEGSNDREAIRNELDDAISKLNDHVDEVKYEGSNDRDAIREEIEDAISDLNEKIDGNTPIVDVENLPTGDDIKDFVYRYHRVETVEEEITIKEPNTKENVNHNINEFKRLKFNVSLNKNDMSAVPSNKIKEILYKDYYLTNIEVYPFDLVSSIASINARSKTLENGMFTGIVKPLSINMVGGEKIASETLTISYDYYEYYLGDSTNNTLKRMYDEDNVYVEKGILYIN